MTNQTKNIKRRRILIAVILVISLAAIVVAIQMATTREAGNTKAAIFSSSVRIATSGSQTVRLDVEGMS